MAVYYRYRSGVETFSVPVPSPSIFVADLKRLIMATSRHGHGRTRGRGLRESVALSDARTGEEYADDGALVPRSSTVVVLRIAAGPPAETISVAPPQPSSPRPCPWRSRGGHRSRRRRPSAPRICRPSSPRRSEGRERSEGYRAGSLPQWWARSTSSTPPLSSAFCLAPPPPRFPCPRVRLPPPSSSSAAARPWHGFRSRGAAPDKGWRFVHVSCFRKDQDGPTTSDDGGGFKYIAQSEASLAAGI